MKKEMSNEFRSLSPRGRIPVHSCSEYRNIVSSPLSVPPRAFEDASPQSSRHAALTKRTAPRSLQSNSTDTGLTSTHMLGPRASCISLPCAQLRRLQVFAYLAIHCRVSTSTSTRPSSPATGASSQRVDHFASLATMHAFADVTAAFRVRARRIPRPAHAVTATRRPQVQCHRREAHVGARRRRWVIDAIRRGDAAARCGILAFLASATKTTGREGIVATREWVASDTREMAPELRCRCRTHGGSRRYRCAPAHIFDEMRSFSRTPRSPRRHEKRKTRGDVFRLAHTTRALVIENTTHLLKILGHERVRTSSCCSWRSWNRVQQYRANHEAPWMSLTEPLEVAVPMPTSTLRSRSRLTHVARASSPLIPREDDDLSDTALAEALKAASPPPSAPILAADGIDMRPRASPRPWSAREGSRAVHIAICEPLGVNLRPRDSSPVIPCEADAVVHIAHGAARRILRVRRSWRRRQPAPLCCCSSRAPPSSSSPVVPCEADVFVDLALAEPLDATFRPRCSPPRRLLAGDIVRGRRRGYGAREPLDATVARSALGPRPSARPSSQFLAAGTVRARHRCGCGVHGAPVACAALRPHSTSLPVRAGPTPSYTSGLAVSARHHRARRPSHARFLAGGTAGGRGPRGYDAWQAPVGGVHALAEPLDAGAAACRAVHERVVAPHIFGDPSSGALGAAAYGARRPVCIRRAGDDAELVLEGCFSRSRPPSVRALSGPLAAGACATLRRFNT
ncbi:hypothetical protein DFH09DRAFT_1375886 [Mycena vulgaris]|nr:hypothetical protein DFH09DRAFT_1375886 [Mycena vulgaris]